MTSTSPALLPVSMSAVALRRIVNGAPQGDAKAESEIEVPTADKLTTWEQESYQLDPSFAASVGFPVADLSASAKMIIMLFGIAFYADVPTNREVYRYGVAIRALLQIVELQGKAKLNLPEIAAQVQLGEVEADSQLIVAGYSGDIGAELPPWTSFDVTSYSTYITAVSNLQSKIFNDQQNMKPVLLATTAANPLANQGDVKRGLFGHGFL